MLIMMAELAPAVKNRAWLTDVTCTGMSVIRQQHSCHLNSSTTSVFITVMKVNCYCQEIQMMHPGGYVFCVLHLQFFHLMY